MNQNLIRIITTAVLCLLCSCAPRQEAIDRYYYMEMDPDERAYTDSVNEMSPEQRLITETYREQVVDSFNTNSYPALSEGMLLVDMLPLYYEVANSFYAFRDLTPPQHLEELHLAVLDTMMYLGDSIMKCADVMEQNASQQPTLEEIVTLITPILEEMVSIDDSALELLEKELGI